MDGQVTSLLEQGIKAARRNQDEQAREALLRVIEMDQFHEKAWLWLSSVVESQADKAVCLENVLFINPDNAHAASGLCFLRKQPGDEGDAESLHLIRLCDLAEKGEQIALPQEHIRRRGRSLLTLFEAWAGALVFNRTWAFGAEAELASWKRSLPAFALAVLFASGWHGVTSFLLWLLRGKETWGRHVFSCTFFSALYTLPPAMLVALAGLPVMLLTWATVRLVGERPPLKTHAHLAIVAWSVCMVWAALLAPLAVLVPYAMGGDAISFTLASVAVVLVAAGGGAVWLAQAVYTVRDVHARQAAISVLLSAALVVAFLLALHAATGGRSTGLLARLVAATFFPLPDLAGGLVPFSGN